MSRRKELTVPKEGNRKFNFNRGFFEPAFTKAKNEQLINSIINAFIKGAGKRWMRKQFK
jgi:hypothetical protein